MHLFPHDLFIDCGNHISEIKVKNIRQKVLVPLLVKINFAY